MTSRGDQPVGADDDEIEETLCLLEFPELARSNFFPSELEQGPVVLEISNGRILTGEAQSSRVVVGSGNYFVAKSDAPGPMGTNFFFALPPKEEENKAVDGSSEGVTSSEGVNSSSTSSKPGKEVTFVGHSREVLQCSIVRKGCDLQKLITVEDLERGVRGAAYEDAAAIQQNEHGEQATADWLF